MKNQSVIIIEPETTINAESENKTLSEVLTEASEWFKQWTF